MYGGVPTGFSSCPSLVNIKGLESTFLSLSASDEAAAS